MLDGSFVPNLAESYDVVTDPANASITFHIRKGIKFSDGTDLNAKAVQWNLQQAMAPGSQAIASTTQWKSIDVVDDYTVRVNLKSFTNLLVRSFADTVSFMASPTAYQKNGLDGSQFNPVGTGAFIQKDFQRDVSMTVTRNPNYWEQGKPYLDGMQFLFVGDNMTADALFKSGGGEVLAANAQIASELSNLGYKVITDYANGSVLVPDSLNADSPWSNLKVRQAAEYALDKESLAKAFGFGFQQAAYQYNGSTSPGFDPALASQYRKYNLAKAKQLLAEAGYPNGFKTTMLCTPYGSNKDTAIAMQAMLSAVGIQADVQFPQASAWSQYQTGTWHNAILYTGVLQYANPNAGWNLALGTNTLWYQSLKKPDSWPDLLNAALKSPKVDPALEQKCEDALFNDSTYIMLNLAASTWVVTDKVQDTGLGSRGIWGWFEPQNAWISK
jgi:peptide/nickel transport system substrate-binding protein